MQVNLFSSYVNEVRPSATNIKSYFESVSTSVNCIYQNRKPMEEKSCKGY